jgi:hypothetical protein
MCRKYVVFFNAFVYLTANDEETMIFSKYVNNRTRDIMS